MGTRHVVFDDLLKLWEATATTAWTAGNKDSTVIDFGASTYVDAINPPEIWIDWPGVNSAGAATTVLVLMSDANATPTTVIWTSRTFTLAETIAFFDTAEYYRLPLPVSELGRYFMLRITVGVATINAGAITAALGSPLR